MASTALGTSLQSYADSLHARYGPDWRITDLPEAMGFAYELASVSTELRPLVLTDATGAGVVIIPDLLDDSELLTVVLARCAAEILFARQGFENHCQGSRWYAAARLAIPRRLIHAVRRGDIVAIDAGYEVLCPPEFIRLRQITGYGDRVGYQAFQHWLHNRARGWVGEFQGIRFGHDGASLGQQLVS